MEKLLREVLSIWGQVGLLANHPLGDLVATSLAEQYKMIEHDDPVRRRALALRKVILEGIRTLGVEDETPPAGQTDPKWHAKEWRDYSILTLSLDPTLSPPQIAERLCLAVGGHFYDAKKKAIEKLATVLCAREGRPTDEWKPILLSLPSGALKLTDRRYIERQADRDLRMILSSQGETFIIRGPRQIGKTSLLLRAANQVRRQFGAQIVYFDFQKVDQRYLTTLDTALYQLAQVIVEQLGLDPEIVEQAWQQSKLAPTLRLERLMERHVLPTLGNPIVLALDEVDRLLPMDFRQDFFGMLRAWHNNRALREAWDHLFLILVISTEPYLLIDDLNQSPFNVGHKLYLDDFNEQQLKQLNQLYDSPLHEADLSDAMELFQGHPYLTSIALYTLKKEGLSWATLKSRATVEEGPFAEHLHYLHRLLNREPELQQALKQIINHERCTEEQALFRLLKAGLIKDQGATYVCRCALYRQYFVEKL